MKSHVFRFCLGGKRFYNIICVCGGLFYLSSVNSGVWTAKNFLIVDKKRAEQNSGYRFCR